jgi:glycosyltransferase involved in cell wall biosynthesis
MRDRSWGATPGGPRSPEDSCNLGLVQTEQPLVSVVTPVYNGAAFLRECLESVLAQTYTRWEYIIVDNASTDATPDIIAEFASADSRIRPFRNAETVSALRNHNVAAGRIAAASAYFKLLHADDQLLPDCLEKMVAVAEANPSIGMVGGLANLGPKIVCGGLRSDRTCFPGRDVARRTLKGEVYPFWSPSCLLHRTQVVAEREPFYSEQSFEADVQASYEILRKWDFGFVHEPMTIIRAHDASRTSQLANPLNKLLATNLNLLVTYGPDFLDPDELKQVSTHRIDRYYEMLARSVFEWRGRDFWSFHRDALEKAGSRLSLARLMRAALAKLVHEPITSCRRLARGVLKKQHA